VYENHGTKDLSMLGPAPRYNHDFTIGFTTQPEREESQVLHFAGHGVLIPLKDQVALFARGNPSKQRAAVPIKGC